MTIAAIIFIPETNPHILLQRRAKKMRKETGDDRWHALAKIKETPRQLLLNSLVRPMKVCVKLSYLTYSFSVSALLFCRLHCKPSSFVSDNSALGIIFGYVYLLFTTYTHLERSDFSFPQVFGSVYGWSEGIIGLSYLGSGIGFLMGLIVVGTTNDRLVVYLTKKHGVRKPEYRMLVMMFATPLVAIGLFWYGWAAEAKTHWIVPILGTVPIGIGMIGFFLPSFIYTIEAFGFYAASAIAALYVCWGFV